MLENKTTENSPQSSSDGGGAPAAESGTTTLPVRQVLYLFYHFSYSFIWKYLKSQKYENIKSMQDNRPLWCYVIIYHRTGLHDLLLVETELI